MTDTPQHHELRIRHHNETTRPTYVALMVGAGGSQLGLTVRSYLDPEKDSTIVHAIDAQSLTGRLESSTQVADYLEAIAATIRQAHVLAAPDDRTP